MHPSQLLIWIKLQNISEYYPTMLLAQAFVKLIRSWEADELSTLDNQLLRDQVLLVSFRSLSRILHAQDNDGSWGSKGPCEESAYAILALVELSCLPIATLLEEQVQTAITNGRTYLESQRKSGPAEFLWVEKVVYRAQHISEAYIIAALNVSAPAPLDGKKLRSLVGIDTDEVKNSVRLLRKVPLLVAQPEWSLVASLIESRLFLFKVQEMRHSVFSRTGLSKDKYLAWIPFIWSLANNKHQGCLSTRVLSDMMHVSVLNFQVDEFMETIVTALDRVDLPKVHDILEELFESINFLDDGSDQVSRPERTQRGTQAGDRADEGIVRPNTAATSHHERRLAVANAIQAQQYGDNRRAAALSTVADRLGAYITFVSRLATKAGVRPSSLSRTLIELKAFLHAHVTQCQLNQELGIKKQAAAPSDGPLVYDSLLTSSFRHWLHLIAAVHTSCPYSFELYLGLAGAAHKMPLLKTPRQRYMATDLCGHLARMCRLYNDEGSLQRDEQEGNLNCVNFVELRGEWEDTQSPGPAARLIYENDAGVTANASGKRNLGGELMTLAELERKNLMSALKGLGEMTETEVDVMNRLEVFVDVTDLFGQIYVIKDLASRRIRDSKDL